MSGGVTTERSTRWILISGALHVALFAGLWLFTPLREIVTPERRLRAMRPDTVSHQRIEAVQRQLAQRAEDQLRQRVEELQRIDEAMRQVEEVRRTAYEKKADELGADALEVALTEMQGALVHQEQALARQASQMAALTVAAGEVDSFLATHAAFSPSNVVPSESASGGGRL